MAKTVLGWCTSRLVDSTGYRLKAEMLGEALLVAFTDTSNQPFEVDVEAFQEAQIDRLRDLKP